MGRHSCDLNLGLVCCGSPSPSTRRQPFTLGDRKAEGRWLSGQREKLEEMEEMSVRGRDGETGV